MKVVPQFHAVIGKKLWMELVKRDEYSHEDGVLSGAFAGDALLSVGG